MTARVSPDEYVRRARRHARSALTHEERRAAAVAERDVAIRKAIEGGISSRTVAAEVGLSHTGVLKIANRKAS